VAVLFMTICVGVAGCGGQPDVSTPEATVKAMISAGSQGKIEVLKKLITPKLAAKLAKAAPKDRAYLPIVAVALGKSRVGPAKVSGASAVVVISVDRDIALNQLSRYLDEYGSRYALSDDKKRRAFNWSFGSGFRPRYRVELVNRSGRWLIQDWKGVAG
jgi:hypothetical protein